MTRTYQIYQNVLSTEFQNLFLMMLVQMSQTFQNRHLVNSMPQDFQLSLVEEFVTYLSSQMVDLKVHQRQSNLKKGITKE